MNGEMKYNYRLSHKEAAVVARSLREKAELEIAGRLEKQLTRWKEFEQEVKSAAGQEMRGGGI